MARRSMRPAAQRPPRQASRRAGTCWPLRGGPAPEPDNSGWVGRRGARGAGERAVTTSSHLHLHTQYSLLDGAIRTKDLCKTVKERGMTSVAVTDHGNMFGALQFYQEAKAQGVKPIFGCEVYLSDGDMKARADRKNYHLVLLARNQVGFKNLQFLVSKGHLAGFYYNPRIDRSLLREHSEGLVGLPARRRRGSPCSRRPSSIAQRQR